LLKPKIQTLLLDQPETTTKTPITLTFQEILLSSMVSTHQKLSDNHQIDGKAIQTILVQLNFQLLKQQLPPQNLLFKLQSTQMVQPVLFHKKLINNTMESHNSRNQLTSETQKTLMTLRLYSTQMQNRNRVFCLMLKLKLIQTLLSEQLETTTKMQTMLIFPEIQFLSKDSTVTQLLENNLTDGKETHLTLVQLRSQLLHLQPLQPPQPQPHHQHQPQHLFKRKPIQTLPSELPVTTTKMPTMLTFLVIQFLSKNSLEQQL
jgi:hypothetical protein